MTARPVRGRSIALLVVLAAIAIGLAFVDSAVVPASWNEWLPVPRLGLPPGVRPGDDNFATPLATPGRGTPAPAVTATPSAEAERNLPQGERVARNLAFYSFGFQRTLLNGFAAKVASLILLVVTGVLTLYAVPHRIGNIIASMREGSRPILRLLLLGLAGYLVLIVLAVLAAAALLGGIAVLLVTIIVYMLALITLVAVALPLGRAVASRLGVTDQAPVFDLIDGMLVIFIASVIPFIGTLLLAIFTIVGFGALLQTRAGSDRGWDFDLESLQY